MVGNDILSIEYDKKRQEYTYCATNTVVIMVKLHKIYVMK